MWGWFLKAVDEIRTCAFGVYSDAFWSQVLVGLVKCHLLHKKITGDTCEINFIKTGYCSKQLRIKVPSEGKMGGINMWKKSYFSDWFSPVTQDGQAMLWDLNEGKHLYTLDGGDIINALCFSPNRYWLCAATGPSIKIWVSVGCNWG